MVLLRLDDTSSMQTEMKWQFTFEETLDFFKYILVADFGNDVMHFLNSNGKFVTHVLTSISPISQPWGICVDSENRLWVVERSNNEGEVKTFAKVKVFRIYWTKR